MAANYFPLGHTCHLLSLFFFSLIQYLIPGRLKKKAAAAFCHLIESLKLPQRRVWPIKSEKFNCNNKLMLLITTCFFAFFVYVYLTSLHLWFWDSLPTCLSSYLDLLFILNFFCPVSLMSFFFSSRLRDPVASRYGVLSVSSRGCLCLLRAPTGRPQPGKLHTYLVWNWIMRISIFGWSFTSAYSLASFYVSTLSSTM